MVPMVTEVSRSRRARTAAKGSAAPLHFGELPRKLQFGAMLEVPALLWQLDELMTEVDFVSVGSNDLFQFAMAVDRGNARVSDRFECSAAVSPAPARHRAGRRPQRDAGDVVR